ncbi:hypothetical protein GQR58_028394 [Nymphon striatum]|nr:hypothetical protein GQR58_028394 [Nymphon striatum]
MSKASKCLKTLWCTGAILSLASVVPQSITVVGVGNANAQNIVKVKPASQGVERISLGLDKSIVLDLPEDAYDILVANPDVADAVTRTARRIYLFGKQVGETNIFVFNKAGDQIANFDLQIERDVAGLDRHLARFIKGSDIKTEIINDNIVLTGSVQTPQDSAKAAQLAEIFVKGGDATNNGAESFLALFSRGNSQIVNLLEIAGGDQVTLKVTVAEVQRSVMKQLGINLLGSRTGSNGISFNGISESIAGALGKPLSNSGAVIGGAIGGLQLDAYFRAMEQAGVMKTLSTPTLTAVSGETAVFDVGGTYNVISGSDAGEDGITYEFKEIDYGVGLEFTPVVLSPGRISLKIKTSVSEPTTEGTVSLSVGGSAPATNVLSIRRREADTTVELPSGGSMMIAGLIRDDVRQVVSGFPGLSKLPVLGALFRSRDFVRNESELVIMVTPYLVRPVPASQIALPTDNLNMSSDAAANLLGRVNRIYGSVDQKMPNGRYHGAVGFIYNVPSDYTKRHPIVLAEKEQTLDIPIASNAQKLNVATISNVKAFAQNFVNSGTGTIIMMLPSSSANSAAAHRVQDQIIRALEQGGGSRGNMAIQSYNASQHGSAAPIRLSFRGVTASTSQCGQWPDDLTNTAENKNYYDYGCSTQNNLAAQISNPGDLLGPRATSPIDAANRGAVISDYQGG